MSTYNPDFISTYNLLRGLRRLRGLISTVTVGVKSTLNLQGGTVLMSILVGVVITIILAMLDVIGMIDILAVAVTLGILVG